MRNFSNSCMKEWEMGPSLANGQSTKVGSPDCKWTKKTDLDLGRLPSPKVEVDPIDSRNRVRYGLTHTVLNFFYLI